MDRTSTAFGESRPDREARRHTSRPSPRKNFFLVAAIALVFLAGVLLAGGLRRLVEMMYDPAPLAVAALLLGQYVLLKGRDRSRLYRLELERMREKRVEDLRFLDELAGRLEQLEEDVATLPRQPHSDEESRPGSYQVQEVCTRIHDLAARARAIQ